MLAPIPGGAAQRPRWLLGSGRGVEYQRFEAPGKGFSLEYPKKEWQVVSGAGSIVVVFAQSKSEASVAIDHTLLKTALAPEEITQLFADLEVEHVKQRDSGVQGIRTALQTDTDGRRIIVIDYTRVGLKGQEQVRQYSLPFGADLFRLICNAQAASFAKHEPVFEHMAQTFRGGAPITATADEPKPAGALVGTAPAAPDASVGMDLTTAAPPQGAKVTPPKLVKQVPPQYPARALASHIEGVVTVRASIDPAGSVVGVEVVKSMPSDPDMVQAALRAVRQWKFSPALVDGVPTSVVLTVNVAFRLEGRV
ncbi:MAG: hypothetical protein A3H96_16005 [Acidobacteria bacterium RIFCSPLOWO2_02_FULL_67_36]|nr:MAG: hypothetical protein A3H96_16005 [Acidobacteria bacterium RIFCSPLOWO2_02_FULL_67_36]OFW21222.1 MAG: hypothetical protein A3G21_11220 [Acidobacteria bacterium RIFCSPLOWO2_12_FULL_66_21]